MHDRCCRLFYLTRRTGLRSGFKALLCRDLQANTQRAFSRLHYLPDGGHGALDPLLKLGGNAGVHQTLPGCGIPGNIPNSAVLGPDGNLYVGFKQSGNILRIVSPQTEPLPCEMC